MSVTALTASLERRHGLRCDGVTLMRLQRELLALAGQRSDLDAVAAAVLADPEAQQALVDRVTLQETAFFRDPGLWSVLARDVLPAAIERAAGRPLRVWSAGCAYGQEAWSLAMLLAELGLRDFEVTATDLSRTAADRAAAGRYAVRELRGLSPERRARFGTLQEGTWEVGAALRSHVRVLRHDLSEDPPGYLAAGSVSLVLCRYVLIYLTPVAAGRLLGRLAEVLEPEGRLAIGAAESLWHVSDRFASEAWGDVILHRPRRPATADAPIVRRAPAVPRRADTAAPSRPERRPPGRVHAVQRDPLPARGRAGEPGGGASRRADAGTQALGRAGGDGAGLRVPEGAAATRTGNEPLVEQEALARQAATLLRRGEDAVAAGDLPAAAQAFRGASYLRPDDPLAPLQLGLALEAAGDPGALRAFRAARAALGRGGGDALRDGLGGFSPLAVERLLESKLREPEA